GRPRVIGKPQWRALAEHRYPQRKIGPAHARTTDRADADDAFAFLDRARAEALDLGLVPPWLALGEEAAATRERTEQTKDDGADEIPTNSPRHGRRMLWTLLTLLQRSVAAAGCWCATRDMVKRSELRGAN